MSYQAQSKPYSAVVSYRSLRENLDFGNVRQRENVDV